MSWLRRLTYDDDQPDGTVPLHNAIVAHSPLWHVILAGIVGGVLMWLAVILGGYVFAFMVSIPYSLLKTRFAVPPVAWIGWALQATYPYILGTACVGGMLALLRRVSVRSKKSLRMFRTEWDLDTLAASIGGLAFAAATLTVYSQQAVLFWSGGGPIAPFLGFVFDQIWRSFHIFALTRLFKPDRDIVLANEIEEEADSL